MESTITLKFDDGQHLKVSPETCVDMTLMQRGILIPGLAGAICKALAETMRSVQIDGIPMVAATDDGNLTFVWPCNDCCIGDLIDELDDDDFDDDLDDDDEDTE